MPEQQKKQIGKWGEEYTLWHLKKYLAEQHPQAKAQECVDGRHGTIFSQQGQVVAEVIWLNGGGKDTGVGYDLRMQVGGVEYLIEVKTTTDERYEWFKVSGRQWETAKTYRDRYWIVRVYNAGKETACLSVIRNPAQAWEDDELGVTPVQIRI